MLGLPVIWATFESWQHSLRTDVPAAPKVLSEGVWAYFAEDMSWRAAAVALVLVAACKGSPPSPAGQRPERAAASGAAPFQTPSSISHGEAPIGQPTTRPGSGGGRAGRAHGETMTRIG